MFDNLCEAINVRIIWSLQSFGRMDVKSEKKMNIVFFYSASLYS